ncbi:MAG: phosphotransferase enzyme family protein [Nocardioides sp.]|uniref:phosphotransferase enzyme family protein n=1 Tax=Nocardioides sp. TaxID=35761 RepID=UPI003D6A39A9
MTATSSEPFTAERAEPLLTAAAAKAGLPLPAPRLLRLGENAVFTTGAQLVARVGRSPAAAPTAAREVAIGSWLAHATEVPVARPVDIPQPILVEGHPVTFWEEIPDPSEATFPELAGTLRVFHAVDAEEVPADIVLPELDPFNRISSRIESAPIPERQRSVLRSVYDELVEAWDTVTFTLPPGPIHGDAHTSNLLRGKNGRLALIDLEDSCFGPREWDLAMAGTYAKSLGWIDAATYRDFVEIYGTDVTESPSFPTLRRIRELRMTSWMSQLAADERFTAQVEHRVACLLDDDLPRHWAAH